MKMMNSCVATICILSLALCVFGQRPVGVHFDVEPAALPGGAEGNAAQFISLFQKLKAVTNGQTRLSADLPMGMGLKPLGAWYYQNRPISYHIADIVDSVTLMAYRDKAAPTNGITDHAAGYLNYARQIGKKVVVGVETNCNLGDIVSFCEEGQSYMEGQLSSAVSTLNSYGSTFGGLAIHDYEGFVALSGVSSSLRLSSNVPCRAMWVWTHTVVNDAAARAKFIDFCVRMRICTVYQESQGLVDTSKQTQLRSFVNDLWAKGISVEILFGNHEWTYTANHPQAVNLAKAAVNFINSFPAGGGSVTGTPQTPSTTGAPNNNGGDVGNTGNTCAQRKVTRRIRISDGGDDVEQQPSNGNKMSCTSSDLEFVRDGKMDQIVGLRFKNVDVSAQDTIVGAYIEMKSKKSASTQTNLVIQGEKTGNSQGLCDQSNLLSSKAKTSSAVSWNNVPAWSAGQIVQTPDITSVVKEIVGQSSWNAGNAMTLMVSGSGMRQVYSHNGGAAPYLVLELQSFSCGAGLETSDDTTDWWADTTNTVEADDDGSSSTRNSALLGLVAVCAMVAARLF